MGSCSHTSGRFGVLVYYKFIGKMTICGPKLSICCSVISAWALVQLSLMGVFFYIRSPALIEDVFVPEEAEHSPEAYIDAIIKSYQVSAYNCWIATAMYAATFIFSAWQVKANFS